MSKFRAILHLRLCFGGMTAAAPILSSSARIYSTSKALSSSRASKWISPIKGSKRLTRKFLSPYNRL